MNPIHYPPLPYKYVLANQPSSPIRNSERNPEKAPEIILQPFNSLSTISSKSSGSCESKKNGNENWITKPNHIHVAFLENDLEIITLKEALNLFFPQGFQFLPPSPEKNRNFYETILENTGSVKITHNFDLKDSRKILFSKVQIRKIISPSQWDAPFCSLRAFSCDIFPSAYTYWDYIHAWTNSLFYDGSVHTWFLYFDRNCQSHFPTWWLNWWKLFGPTLEIYPLEIQSLFHEYSKFSTEKDNDIRLLNFCNSFSIPWIMCWCFHLDTESFPKKFIRKIKTKHWQKIEIKKIVDQVNTFLAPLRKKTSK